MVQRKSVMSIGREGIEILIPMNDDFIISLDREAKTITVNTPPGLIELYLE